MMSRYKGLSWSLLSHGQIHTNQYWSERGLSGISEPLGFYMTLWLYLSHCVCLKWMWGICRWQRQCKCRCISFLSMCLSPCVLAGHGCWVLINNFLQYSDGFRYHISHLPSKVWLEKNKNDRFTWPTNLEWSDHRRSIWWCYPAAGTGKPFSFSQFFAPLVSLVVTRHIGCQCGRFTPVFWFFRKPKVLCVAASDDQDTYKNLVVAQSCWIKLTETHLDHHLFKETTCFLTGHLKGNWKTMKNTRGPDLATRFFLDTTYILCKSFEQEFWNCCRSSLPSSRTLVLKV